MDQSGTSESFATGNEVAADDLARGMGERVDVLPEKGFILGGNDTVH